VAGGGADDGWDFFVSYAQMDRPWAEWVAWTLEDASYRVLLQAWDLVPGSNWPHLVHDGVRRGGRLVAVVSPAYLASVGGTAEWEAVWAADPEGTQRRVVPVLVADCDRRSLGLLGTRSWIDLTRLAGERDGDLARARLLDGIGGAIAGRAKPSGPVPLPDRTVPVQPRFPGDLPTVWNVPPRHPHFVGRQDLLGRLSVALENSSTVTVQAVVGTGGVGKTLLAIEYAHRNSEAFDLVWWIQAENPMLIGNQIAALAAELGLPVDADVAMVLAALDRRDRCLLVFDNAELPEQLVEFRPPGPGCRILVTSRQTGWGGIGATVDADVFDRADSIALLTRRVPQIDPSVADLIASLLGDLPLALEQAAAYLDRTRMPPGDYFRLLEDRIEDMLSRGQVVGHSQTIATLWDVSLERLASESSVAVDMLNLVSLLGPDPVPLSLFTGDARLPDISDALQRALTDQVEFAHTVGTLVGYCLGRREIDGISVHRLTQATLRSRMSHADQHHYLRILMRLLSVALPEVSNLQRKPDLWPRWRQLLPHIIAVVDHPVLDGSSDLGAYSDLLDGAGSFYQVLGQPAEARRLLRRAVDAAERERGADDWDVGSIRGRLALVLGELGLHAEALSLHEQVLASTEALCRRSTRRKPWRRREGGPQNDSRLATPLSNLALTWWDLGRPDRALPLLERALAIDEHSNGPDAPDVGSSMNAVAIMLQELGRAEQARPLLERALTITETAYGPDHPQLVYPLNNLGEVLRELGRAEQARPLLERALTITETAYGPDHPQLGLVLNNLGEVLRELGRAEQARPLLERALTITKTAYGPDQPQLGLVLNNLGLTLRELGRAEQARPLLERALTITKTAYGPDHPNVALIRRNLDRIAGRDR